MEIKTTRFGKVVVESTDIVEFPEGILGFSTLTKYVLLDDPSDEIFAWLQSCEEGSIAFPILEPELFEPHFRIKLSRHDLEELRISESHKTRSFVIVTVPDDVVQMTANMKAPVVINVIKRIGRQCVLQDNDLNIRDPIFSKLQQRMIQAPTVSIKPKPHSEAEERWVHPEPIPIKDFPTNV